MFLILLSVASFFVTSSATQPGATTGWVTQTIYDTKDLSCQGQPREFLAYALGLCFLYNGNYSFNSGNVTLSQFPKFQVVGNLFVKTYGQDDSTCSGKVYSTVVIGSGKLLCNKGYGDPTTYSYYGGATPPISGWTNALTQK